MNLEMFERNLLYIEKMFPNQHSLNKSNTQTVIKMSASTWARKEKANEKYDLPRPAIEKPYKCSNRTYCTYMFPIYELAIFITDIDYYWEVIHKKEQKNELR